jgi:hypothetical protein
MKRISMVLIAIGIVVVVSGLFMDTSYCGVYNFSRGNDRIAVLFLGACFFIGGLVLYGFSANAAQAQPKQPKKPQLKLKGYALTDRVEAKRRAQAFAWLDTPQEPPARELPVAPPTPTRVLFCPFCRTQIGDDPNLSGRLVACRSCLKTFLMP